MISERKLLAIRTLGKIEEFQNELRTLSAAIDGVPLWRPGVALKKQCDEVVHMMEGLEQRFDRKLLVTILGPCGAGKSTLLNALSGVDDLSEAGHGRPTTRHLVLLCREEADAAQLQEQLGRENVEIRSSHTASALEHLILVDTPDTDSSEQEKHIPLVQKAIAVSDVLICVFNAQNPKTRDYADFLAPYVRQFKGESLVCVANKCDRLAEEELQEVIVPGFLEYIRKAWERPVDKVLCISARRHLHDPGWDDKAMPRHDFDQFKELETLIFSTFNQAGYVIDRRLENAQTLRDYVTDEVQAEVEKDRESLEDARNRITETEASAARTALSALKADNTRQILGVNVLLYQKLAQRWVGPVGWLIALWARILIFGTGIAAIFRFGNPVSQVMGMVSSFMHFKESRAAVAETGKSERVDTALRDYQQVILRNWPAVAEALIRGRFDPCVRNTGEMLPDSEALNDELTAMWNKTLDHEIEKASKELSGLITQFFFNIPCVGIMGYVGWLTARAFFDKNYLSSDFFLHAFLTIGIVMFLSFFIFQGCVRLFSGTDRITRKAFDSVKAEIGQFQPVSLNPVGEQAGSVLGLSPKEGGNESVV